MHATELHRLAGQTSGLHEGPALRHLIYEVRSGVAVAVVDELIASGRRLAEIDRTVLPRKTLAHRRKLGRLSPEQSDRLLRVVRILALAEETFANAGKAHLWLRRPTQVLAGERPIDLLDTEAGARQVEMLLGRIGHGIAA
ncbi:MAG: antitoxin Xre/MbcA/ParS toxin-binding domain-containing protein [Gammaproteobacteria bacterium]